MERCTEKRPDGRYIIKPGLEAAAALQLARFEDMYESLLLERRDITAKLDALKAEGKTKSVTFSQLLSGKLMISDILIRLEVHGIK